MSRSLIFHNFIVLSVKERKKTPKLCEVWNPGIVATQREWMFEDLVGWECVCDRPLVESRNWAAFFCGSHLILLIFSSISKLLR